jgi:hypothetical protein
VSTTIKAWIVVDKKGRPVVEDAGAFIVYKSRSGAAQNCVAYDGESIIRINMVIDEKEEE